MARQRVAADYGPELRLSRGDVVVEGEAVSRGRALSIVDELGPELRGAVALLLRLFEAARRQLAAIEKHVGPLMWSTVTDLLLWGKSAEAWAFECRGRGYRLDRKAAKAALTCALDAIAAMKPPRRAS